MALSISQVADPGNPPIELDTTDRYLQIDSTALMQAELRNRQVDFAGKSVTFTIPLVAGDPGATWDDFGDPIDKNTLGTNAEELETKIIPLWSAYYPIIDLYGTSVEGDLPLECIVKTTDEFPIGATVSLDVNSPTAHGTQNIVFEVMGTTVKHIDGYYAKTISLVPKRGTRTDGPITPETGV